MILLPNIDTNKEYCYATTSALFSDGLSPAALEKPCVKIRRSYGCNFNISTDLRELPSPAETISTFSTAASEENNLTVMSSEATPNSNERVQETAFNDASIVQNMEAEAPATGLTRFDELSSILAFLERPSLLWQSRLDSSIVPLVSVNTVTGPNITQTPIKTFTFPSDLFNVGNKLDKICNFEWFKSDIRLRVQINANPFIAGRLWITYSPLDSSPNVSTLQSYARIDKKGRVGLTSYPGVELDLQTNTAAEITVPWIAEADAERADISSQQLFRVDIWAITPLLVADSSLKIPIQVYGSFTNIQLKFPTPIYRRTATLQVKAAEAKGPITEVMSGVKRTTDKYQPILSNIPVVGTIASAVNWASGIAEGIASTFGWSRPIEGSHAVPFAQIPGRGMSQFKAKDSSVVLGMHNENSVAEAEQNFISDVDEMELSHICSRPGLIDVIDWPVTADFNDGLGAYSASREPTNYFPVSFSDATSTYTGIARDYTLAEFVLSNFHMYRADFVYRISLVKTAFHVGRFEVFFVPNVNIAVNDPAVKNFDTTNCYRQIFDITEQSEMTFTVPYFHKYVMMQRGDVTSGDQGAPTIGSLVIRVVSPLTCPDTVSQSIKILIWKHAENVAVAQPHTLAEDPLLAYTQVSTKKATLQINVTNEPRDTEYCVFDDTHNLEDNLNAGKIVAGEMCVNLREATRSCRRHYRPVSVTNLGSVCPNIIDFRSGGYLSVCSKIFYFFRGGVSYKLLQKTGKGLRTWLSLRYKDTTNTSYTEAFQHCPFHFTPAANPIHEVSVPFYSQTRRQVCSKFSSEVDGIDIEMPCLSVANLDGSAISADDVEIFTAGKDDLTFGFLIGPPLGYQVQSITPK